MALVISHPTLLLLSEQWNMKKSTKATHPCSITYILPQIKPKILFFIVKIDFYLKEWATKHLNSVCDEAELDKRTAHGQVSRSYPEICFYTEVFRGKEKVQEHDLQQDCGN